MDIHTGLPKIAVLMATYNGAEHLHAQMNSILAQQQVSVKIFVRDDHSSDQTQAIVAEYQKAGNVTLLPPESDQLYAAKNFMSLVRDVDLSAFDYMAYSDQDDLWLPEKLHAAITALKQNHAKCYASNVIMGDADAKPLKKKSIFGKISTYLLNYKTNAKNEFDHYLESASAGCTLLLQREAAIWLQHIFTMHFNEIMVDASHDWSTYAVTRLGGFDWYIDTHSYIIYRQHISNAYGANIGLGGIRKLLEWFTSGRYRNHIIMIDDLYNTTNVHPPFIKLVKEYNRKSVLSRWKLALSISRYRRKWIHRFLLFVLILGGYFK